MLASLADAPLDDPQLVYEPKYDGIRAICEVAPGGPVRLWSRLGNEKTSQFPEITAALTKWSKRLKERVVLDGEIVALDAQGDPAGFQQLQGRIHLLEPVRGVPRAQASARTALIAFDLLQVGRHSLREQTLLERRAALEKLFSRTGSPSLRISDMVKGDGRALFQRAMDQGWEGLIAKHAASRYKPGKRTPDWRKLKIVNEQEFVIGGWTEPRNTRSHFGALLLGVYGDDGKLVYVAHTGTGFNERELQKLWALLKPLEIKDSPFAAKPKTNERPHWVKPQLVAQIKFTEWTADGNLRHPVYLGLRDDKKPESVRREQKQRVSTATLDARAPSPMPRASSPVPRAPSRKARASGANAPEARASSPESRDVVGQLRALEDARRDGTIELPGGARVSVTNLQKVFWPKQKITKGDLFRYYVEVAPVLLPAVADRPLVMKRMPNGIAGPQFYQHRATDTPPYVRVEKVKAAESRPQIIGGDLATLLYMVQLASISQDPWFSRVGSPQFIDYVAFDLDPSEGVPFARVLDVARWIRDELVPLGATGVPKTSGSDGVHIYVRMPAQTTYDVALIFCEIVATIVAEKHPKVATIERSVKARGKRVYVDFLQNILSKTLATAYSARASAYAGVSMPLTWTEIDEGVDREDFTIRTAPDRIKKVGDLWAAIRTSKPVDLSRVARQTQKKRT
jgi:bifunctional non-homologous end joining protein LigD